MRFLCTTILTALILSGCSFLKASPAKDSGFLSTPDRLKKTDQFPFHAWWVKPGEKKSKEGTLYIADVNTIYLNKVSDWRHIQVLSEAEISKQANQLGDLLRKEMIKEFQQRKEKRFKVVNSKEASHGVLEVAIVELVPTDVVRNATGQVLGFLLPGGAIVSSGAAGSIAIEGRFVDSKTGEVLAEFKDRETGKYAPIDLAGLTPFRHAEVAIEDWSKQIAKIIYSPPNSVIADSSPFSLLPW